MMTENNSPFEGLGAETLRDLVHGIDAALERVTEPTKKGLASLGDEDNTMLERIQILEHMVSASLHANLGNLGLLRQVTLLAHNEIHKVNHE